MIITNKLTNNYRKAFVEVEAVLDCLEYNEYKKIPQNILDAIQENKDDDYIFEYDEVLDYEEWNLMKETKALLYNIFKNYLATNEQRNYFKEKERLEIIQIEKEKAQKYNTSDIFKNKVVNKKSDENNKYSNETFNNNAESKQMIDLTKEKWYKKIFHKIRNSIKNVIK